MLESGTRALAQTSGCLTIQSSVSKKELVAPWGARGEGVLVGLAVQHLAWLGEARLPGLWASPSSRFS